eukprot:g15847.t1
MAEEPVDEAKDPTMGNAPEVEDFSILKQALQNVKGILTPYDWIEFAQEYETARALRTRMEREERTRRLQTGEESDDELPPEDEILKSRIVEVQNYFSDVIHALMQCHGHITNDAKNSTLFVEVMKFVPKNSRDAVERLTEKNAELTARIADFERKLEEIAEFNEKRQNLLLQKHQQAFEARKQQKLVRTVFCALRCSCQTEWMDRHRAEVLALRTETKEQKKAIKKLDDELDEKTKLLDSFKAKHERQVKVAAEQLQKLQQMEDTLEKMTGKIRLLEQEKRSLEISLKDEVSRRKDAEYGLERTQEELTRRNEEFQELSDKHEELVNLANGLQKELDQTKATLLREQAERAEERAESDKAMKKLMKKYKALQEEYDRFEKEMTEKVGELTSRVTYLVNQNETLTARVAHLEWEVQDTIRQWHENVAQVKKEAAEELERRSKEIYSAFAAERETHLRRLKIQNYELSNRDMYCTTALDLNPLPVPGMVTRRKGKNRENGEEDGSGTEEEDGGRGPYCVQCKKAVVYLEKKEKHLVDMWSPADVGEEDVRDEAVDVGLRRKSPVRGRAGAEENKKLVLAGSPGAKRASISPRSRKSPERAFLSPVLSPDRARSLSVGRGSIRQQTEATFRTRPSVHKG